MNNLRKKLTALILAIFVVSFSVSAQAATLTDVSDTMSSHNASQTGVKHIIKFRPATAIVAPGDIKITWAAGYDLSNVIASADVSLPTGGGVTWVTPVNSDLNTASRTLTLNWSNGTLSSASIVTVTVNFVKNAPTNANLTISVGPDGFFTATDTRTIPTVITNGGVAVSAQVPYPATNPTITNILPNEPIVVSASTSQIISFDLTDVNNDNIDYTITAITDGSVSDSGATATGTSSAKTITFTYFATAATGAKTITVTANDNVAEGGGVVTYNIQLFVI